MLDLTIAIPVRNEERNLAACLSGIGRGFAKRVVVIDSGSTDGTAGIVAQFNVPVIDFEWDGKFPKKRNWFLRTHTPDTKWVLFLDADEVLTEEFREELLSELPRSVKSGYWLNYSIYFEEKPLKGGYPLKKLALFRVGAGEYERIDEEAWSHLDMEIHEHPVIEGDVGEIRSRIDHRDLRGPEAWRKKHVEYAKWEAKRYRAMAGNPAARKSWTTKQRIKYALMGTPFLAPAFFLGCFVLMGGFRDGRRGWAWARLKAGYFAEVYARIQEEKKLPK
jgi:glycosyltransferase involved in cell wall biosynthesis